MNRLALALLLIAAPASAQTFAPGAAVYPSPAVGRHFLDQPVATCVIAIPVSPSAVMLTPCPPGSLSPLPAPTPPGVSVTPPIVAPPAAEPKSPEPREPVVLRIEVVPVPPESKAAPKAVPKAAPKKGGPCP